jgi:hypothetical protein
MARRPLKMMRDTRTHKNILKVLEKRQAEREAVKQTTLAKPPRPVKSAPRPKLIEPEPESPKPAPEKPKLCVGTIFVNCRELGRKWLDLQLRYLKATSPAFHHVSVVNEGKASKYFTDNTEVIYTSKQNKNSRAHVTGLKTLHSYFMKHKDLYDHFLFIDMDAFPIRKNWYKLLTQKLSKWEIAIALRTENLETRLHSSILFTGKEGLSHLKWGVSKVGPDLLGAQESDVQLISHQQQRRDKAFVMLRSNQYQVHPLLCGVYYDLFYHHACGSGRNFNMRSKPYWGHVVSQKFDVMNTIDTLMKNPNEFIGELAGWHKEEYPKV